MTQHKYTKKRQGKRHSANSGSKRRVFRLRGGDTPTTDKNDTSDKDETSFVSTVQKSFNDFVNPPVENMDVSTTITEDSSTPAVEESASVLPPDDVSVDSTEDPVVELKNEVEDLKEELKNMKETIIDQLLKGLKRNIMNMLSSEEEEEEEEEEAEEEEAEEEEKEAEEKIEEDKESLEKAEENLLEDVNLDYDSSL